MAANNQSKDVTDNRRIVEMLKNGDEESFDAVYRYYFQKLYAFSCQYLCKDDAEEVVQDSMIWLWENRDKLIAELNLKTLLFTIVKNKSLNKISHYKVKQKVHQEIVDKFASKFESPDFYLETELFELYQEALKKVPEDFRRTYEMHRNDNLTHKEIAEKLNVSPQLVNYHIGQVLKILRSELKDYLPIMVALGIIKL
jgi:RNA polymerase sigma-70 factor (ECF subfamily)